MNDTESSITGKHVVEGILTALGAVFVYGLLFNMPGAVWVIWLVLTLGTLVAARDLR